jgi:ATP-dependent Clp protease, protease subunit
VAKRTNQDEIELFHDKGIHVPSRTLYLDMDDLPEEVGDEVGPKTASRLIKNIHVLSRLSQDPIVIIMNCGGGSVLDGLAIYDAIRQCTCHVTIQVLGQASSMGAIILQAADHRVAYPFSRILLHDGEDGYTGHSRDLEKNADESKVLRFSTYKILEQRTGKKASYWARKMGHDYYLSAQQALAEKLIDEIIEATEF